MRALVALTVGAALVAGCSGGNKPSPRALKQIDRALANAPGKAQPSVIVKTELAFARMAREDGPRQAFTEFAALGAKIHGPDGVVDAAEFAGEQMSRDEADRFDTKSVFMSCDGSTAVSQGRMRLKDGTVGNYIFVWERQGPAGQRNRDDDETGYRYVYFTGAPDNPQPARKPVVTPGPGDIVVEAIDLVRADIATCGPRETIFLEALAQPSAGTQSGSSQSRDRTLQWNWFDYPGTSRRVTVSLWRKDARDTAFTLDLPSAP